MKKLGERVEEQLEFDFNYNPNSSYPQEPLNLIEGESPKRTYLKVRTFEEMLEHSKKQSGRLIPGHKPFSGNRWYSINYRTLYGQAC